ncbi:hypothetical protein [Methanobacterium sp.]|uniref:hypothetical protein n=1 Tax=Methanobacterium sp. TaxID=2164 RepID=UPI003C745C8D
MHKTDYTKKFLDLDWKRKHKGLNIYYMGDWAFKMTEYIYGYDLDNYNCSNIIKSVK